MVRRSMPGRKPGAAAPKSPPPDGIHILQRNLYSWPYTPGQGVSTQRLDRALGRGDGPVSPGWYATGQPHRLFTLVRAIIGRGCEMHHRSPRSAGLRRDGLGLLPQLCPRQRPPDQRRPAQAFGVSAKLQYPPTSLSALGGQSIYLPLCNAASGPASMNVSLYWLGCEIAAKE